MAWNRPSETRVEARSGSGRSKVRLAALAVVVILVGGAAALWMILGGRCGAGGEGESTSSELIADKGYKQPRKASAPGGTAHLPSRNHTVGIRTNAVTSASVDSEAIPGETNAVETSEAEKKDTRPFKNIMNQLLAMVMPKNPGEMVPPLPLADEMRFTDEQEREMLQQLAVEEHDTEETIKRKELVQSLQDEYFELKKRGWTFVDYLKALQAKVNLDAEVNRESFKIYEGIFNDPNISDEKYLETLNNINKVLSDRGLKPIQPTASGLPEDEDGNVVSEGDEHRTTEEKTE